MFVCFVLFCFWIPTSIKYFKCQSYSFLFSFFYKTQVRYCKFVKEKYWHSYNEGRLDKLAFRDLADAEEAMIDITGTKLIFFCCSL